MSERDGFPAGVPCWVDTMGPDPDRLMDFYGAVFGWEFNGPGEMPGDPAARYHVARLRGRDVAGVASLPADAVDTRPAWNTYIRVDSVDESAAAVSDAGGSVVVGPTGAPPAGKLAVVRDPEGAWFCLWEPERRQGAQLVNEPSAWSMSSVNSRDPDSTAAFYGQVFGWQAEEFDFGDLKPVMFRLPGFVGGEPQQPVPRDLVAVMMPVEPGVDPHWGVDFWIADADAAAATAAERGGTVIAPPDDRAGFRSAALADPNGAVFSVSQLIIGR
jgi:predicted enzyme related to lactoylglutathione lyase